MSVAYLLAALGLAAFTLAAWALFWAMDDGQYDDLKKQGTSILEEDPPAGWPVQTIAGRCIAAI